MWCVHHGGSPGFHHAIPGVCHLSTKGDHGGMGEAVGPPRAMSRRCRDDEIRLMHVGAVHRPFKVVIFIGLEILQEWGFLNTYHPVIKHGIGKWTIYR